MPTLSTVSCLLFAALSSLAFIDLEDLFVYADQPVPRYINEDNQPASNPVDDRITTLGRVLFYDQQLSLNATTSCASCHQQAFAFGDPDDASLGFDGATTGRHSMRLINARFADETQFFWDERAATLEEQTTQPIQDHGEMGFSGSQGQPNLDSLLRRLNSLGYYQRLADFAFGAGALEETHLQRALAQFIRSIQSFDSKFDVGLARAGRANQPFANFTQQENDGKALFLGAPNAGGAGCNACHGAPEFDIAPNSRNNGVIGVLGQPGQTDLTNTRAPSLRDLVNPDGMPNGAFMHDASLPSLAAVIDHYNDVPRNRELDPRLSGGPGGEGQKLNLSQEEKEALAAFLTTLTGSAVYTDPRWSDPFEADGSLVLLPAVSSASTAANIEFEAFPNPTADRLTVSLPNGSYRVAVYSTEGQLLQQAVAVEVRTELSLGTLPSGRYLVSVSQDGGNGLPASTWVVRQ